jgi:hypothetical protein|tara:strand:- start:8826 stop:12731 length:3906 start_codon:yes stop_codon:yes gene_type:complete
MAVTERHMGVGNFTVSFSQEFTPTEIIESIKEWGHIVITPQEVDVNTLSDADVLSTSRYTGIVLNRSLEEGVVDISGQGLQLYLGDGQSKGMVIAESKNVGKVRVYTNTTLAETLFNSSVSSGKPYGILRNESGNSQAITQGVIYEPSGTYIGQHFVQTALSALKEVAEFFSIEYRVNANGTIDAGPAANLFVGVNSDPSTIVVKTGYGEDPNFDGVVPQGLRTEFDATDWVSRVDFVGEVGYFDSATDVAGEANIGSNPYKDLHGNALSRSGLVQQPEIAVSQLNSRAQLMLNELSRVKKVLNLDLEQYEVSGDMQVGDFIFAFDPDIGFIDSSVDATAESRDLYEVTFRGQIITPVKVRVVGLTFPIANGMGVYFRDKDGNYTDLTQYVQFESGAAQVELGDVIRFIGDDLRFDEFSLNRVTAGVFSIPDLPSTPTLQSGTYLNATGDSIGFIRVTVAKPTNVDGSQITDGSHYRIRYKKTTDAQYSYQNFPFTGVNSESLLIQDLTVGVTYDVGVAAIDKSGFKKMSTYDGSGEDLYTNTPSVNASYATNARIEIEKDGQAPTKPKAATIAAGPLRVQVTHYLGKDGTDGNGNPFGNFTIEGDVDHLDIHAVTQTNNVQNFTVNTASKIGEIRVTSGNLLQQIPVIGTIEFEDSTDQYFRIVAVDKSGNESDPSDGQTATANLIAESNITDATITTAKIGEAQITNALIADATITTAKINDLSADKITSGTITGGEITVGGVSNTSGFIKSYNYSTGSAGFSINSDGTAEFQNATIRGTLNASDITAGTLNVNALTSDGSIDGDKITANSITTNQLNFSPLNSTDLDDYVEISALANGNLAITTSGAVQISGSLEVTGTITANAGFVSGVAIVPTSTTSAVNMNGSSSLTSNLIASSGGTFKTGSSGARVELGQDGTDSFLEFMNTSGAVQLQVGLNTNTTSYIASNSSPLSIFSTGVNDTQSRFNLNANVMNFTRGSSVGKPDIKINGVGDTNKYLIVNSSGELDFSSSSVTGGVTSITASGELSLTGAGTGDVTITHSDSDHDDRYYTKSTADIQLNLKANNSAIANFVTNANVDTSHGTHGGGSSHNTHNYFTNADVDGSHHSHPAYLSNSHNSQVGHHTHNVGVATDPHGNGEHTSSFATNAQVNSAVTIHNAVHHSDKRFKEDIKPTSLGLDFVEKIKPVDFLWKDDYLEEQIEDNNIQNNWKKNQKDVLSNVQQGFIAQDLQKAVLDHTGSNTALSAVFQKNFTDKEQNKYKEEELGHVDMVKLVPVLVKSIQELSAKVKLLEARIDEMEEI